ncbi:ATPase [Marinactinospora rubrisoli]|uniref:ATPase n=1 Tax=Marinactinospora rubrisoli TaxID=2715399 RepID=A0ABW2KLV3_9ACTN
MTQVAITTAGYLHGELPAAHISLDLRRHFRDPHINPALRYLTGRDQEVYDTVLSTPGIDALIDATVAQVEAYLAGPSAEGRPVEVVVACAGGRHRAAVVGAELDRRLRARGVEVELVHRDLDKDVVAR